MVDRDTPEVRQESIARLEKLAGIVNKTRQHFTGQQIRVAPHAATAADELQSLMDDLPPHAYGRRFNRLRLRFRRTIHQFFAPITAHKIRRPATQPEEIQHPPQRPTQAQIDEVLTRPEFRHLMR